jgi:uncharacterized membrane protein YdjX (TVP38/TMEM64 family)
VTPARWWRLVALVVMVVGLLVVVKTTGLMAYLEKDRLRATVTSAGAWGPLVFVGAFCLGELAHVPGTLFVAAAVFAYGRTLGGALAYVGAVASFSFVFAVVRAVGGKPLAEIRWPLAKRILSHLDERPVRTILALRLLLWMSPQLNYVLALSNVRFARYVAGSAAGLALPVLVLVVLADRLLN